MLLASDEADLFFKLHRALMCFVNLQLEIVPNIDTPDDFSSLPPERRLEVRTALLKKPYLLEAFVEANPFDLEHEELDIVSSWRHHVSGQFFILRYLTKYTVFLKAEEPAVAYGVLGLTEPLDYLVGPYLPVWTETVLLPFQGKIIYDGLLSSYNMSFGPGIRRSLNEDYKAAKQRLGIVTFLPMEARPLEKKQQKRARPQLARAKSEEVQEVLRMVVGMTDQFCRQHLNDEYADACRDLAEKLARKRPSPLLSGKPHTWACGIIRTIGWVNYLDDPSQQPYIKLTEIDQGLGVSQSTGQAKSKQIRTLLKIQPFDPQWTLPSRLDDNPLVWMLSVNGFLMDIRHCPREAQEVAFQKGLIPYIPADRRAGV